MKTATVPLCQHWIDKTTRCASPAMRLTQYCYSHHRERARQRRKIAERTRLRGRWFESAPLKDAASVQRALMQVMRRLVSGDIDHKQAGQILYKLQTASVNFDREFEKRRARPQKGERKKKGRSRILRKRPGVT